MVTILRSGYDLFTWDLNGSPVIAALANIRSLTCTTSSMFFLGCNSAFYKEIRERESARESTSSYRLIVKESEDASIGHSGSGTQFITIVEYAPSQRVPKQWFIKDRLEGMIEKGKSNRASSADMESQAQHDYAMDTARPKSAHEAPLLEDGMAGTSKKPKTDGSDI
ncbi:hypothetical protein SSX86_018747 [Deinandra increscens subsp. villosa]|uniref:Uncharacterized protein n=1 Tax=Deinandra increscens subsp. villosa TaxID=3103831 RepID=A0AAP0CW44_9ASTR